MRRPRPSLKLFALAAWAASLVLPALRQAEDPHGPLEGVWVLAVGWRGLAQGQLARLANPLMAAAAFLRPARAAVVAAGAALTLALTSVAAPRL